MYGEIRHGPGYGGVADVNGVSASAGMVREGEREEGVGWMEPEWSGRRMVVVLALVGVTRLREGRRR